jgi:hypothetical protein
LKRKDEDSEIQSVTPSSKKEQKNKNQGIHLVTVDLHIFVSLFSLELTNKAKG